MSRGPVPQKGIDIALPIALARGFVIFCRHYYGYVCDLVIAEIGRTTIVRVCRTKRLYDTVAGMAGQFGTGIAGLCRVPRDPGRPWRSGLPTITGVSGSSGSMDPDLSRYPGTGHMLDPAALPEGAEKKLSPVNVQPPLPKGKKAPATLKGGPG